MSRAGWIRTGDIVMYLSNVTSKRMSGDIEENNAGLPTPSDEEYNLRGQRPFPYPTTL